MPMNASRALRLLFLALLVLQSSGCTSPSLHMDERAADLGFQRTVVQGDGYEHVAYTKQGRSKASSVLHVYLGGDGTPWLRKRVAAIDPTPRTPLMLELMSLDPAPSLYLGRPCYHGLNKSKACSPDLWTDRRYSEAVVASMSAALDHLSVDYQRLVLLGYSGGGTLAMLLAERQPKTGTIITVAANLDTARWVELHGQQPLSGSLNPAARASLPLRIRQLHIAGENDDNVPPLLVHEAISRQQGAEFKVFPKQDHRCCWGAVWPQILGWMTDPAD